MMVSLQFEQFVAVSGENDIHHPKKQYYPSHVKKLRASKQDRR